MKSTAQDHTNGFQKAWRVVRQKGVSFGLTFVFAMVFWVILSGKMIPLILSLGVVSSLIVAFLCHELLFPNPDKGYIRKSLAFLGYLPWLLKEIFMANIHLLKLVFDPRMMDKIDPHIVGFQSPLRQDLSLVAMANSITLTPGTITVTVDSEGRFQVHAIDCCSAEGLPGVMEQKLLHVFESREES
jgi:multicomponent Na+:H+ antiporter subunit E